MQKTNITSPYACIYHADCIDGTAAAALVLQHYKTVKLFPLSHRRPDFIHDIVKELPEAVHVLFVDTSTKAEVLLEAGYSLTIIDHHQGDKAEIENWLSQGRLLQYIFNQDESAATLVFKTLYPEKQLPEVLKYVRDSDLWLQEFVETRYVTNYLSMYRNDPAKYLELFDLDVSELMKFGQPISDYIDQTIARLIKLPPIAIKLGNHVTETYNISDHESACGNMLAIKNKNAAVMFTILGNQVKFSFRSLTGQTPSALGLAQIIGGGGHELSAGGDMTLADFIKAIQN